MRNEEREAIRSLRRAFIGQDLENTFIFFDGHTARNEFLRDCWNLAVTRGWLEVKSVELEQESYLKGYLTELGQKEILSL